MKKNDISKNFQPKKFLITIDTCAANEEFYKALDLLERIQELLPDGFERRTYVLAVPAQILREQAHIHSPVMVPFYLGKAEDPKGLLNYWRKRVMPDSGIYAVETGYCSSFHSQLSTKIIPQHIEALRERESLLPAKFGRGSLNLDPERKSSGTDKTISILNSQANITAKQTNLAFIELYTRVALLMLAIQDAKYEKFITNPRILGNLRSASALQVLRDAKIWPQKHDGVMKTAHTNCGDFAILQMYTNYLPEHFPLQEWTYIAVSKDGGLLNNLSRFYVGEKSSTRNLSHSFYSRHLEKHSLKDSERSEQLPLSVMYPRDFLQFVMRQLYESLQIEQKISTSHTGKKTGNNFNERVNEWLEHSAGNYSTDLIDLVNKLKKTLVRLSKDHLEKAPKSKVEKHSFLHRVITSNTRDLITSGTISPGG